MKNTAMLMLALVLVTGCSTPKTVLKNPKTGQVETCGGSATGSLVGGVVGYHIQKSNDSKCAQDLMAQGFKPVDKSPGTTGDQ
jgi:uncharacterized protein YcfJ